jgi:hypothetical protein
MSACATLLDAFEVMITVLRAVSSSPRACRCTPTVCQRSGRSPYVNRHRKGTGLRLVARPCVHRSQELAADGRAGVGRDYRACGEAG